MSNIKVTVVEEGTEFKGTLTSSCPVDVRGRVEGELQTPSLTVSASGAVHGHAKVGAVRSEGEISGEFEADSVELSGRVRDNTVIRARSLEVKLERTRGIQVMFGECELSVGDEPTEHDRANEVAAARASLPVEMPPVVELPAAAAVPAEAMAMPEAPAAEAVAAEAEAEAEAEGEADASSGEGKRRRKRKNGQDEPVAGWSQPPASPSQPPPAN
jgi:cytoskeletal protein CcmA (bactofilin family)